MKDSCVFMARATFIPNPDSPFCLSYDEAHLALFATNHELEGGINLGPMACTSLSCIHGPWSPDGLS